MVFTKRYLEVMEVLLPFASEGVQGIPDAAEFLHRAAAGGFVALTDKMATLNGTLLSLQYLNTFFQQQPQMEKLTLWMPRGNPHYSMHASTITLQWSNFLSTNIMLM